MSAREMSNCSARCVRTGNKSGRLFRFGSWFVGGRSVRRRGLPEVMVGVVELVIGLGFHHAERDAYGVWLRDSGVRAIYRRFGFVAERRSLRFGFSFYLLTSESSRGRETAAQRGCSAPDFGAMHALDRDKPGAGRGIGSHSVLAVKSHFAGDEPRTGCWDFGSSILEFLLLTSGFRLLARARSRDRGRTRIAAERGPIRHGGAQPAKGGLWRAAANDGPYGRSERIRQLA